MKVNRTVHACVFNPCPSAANVRRECSARYWEDKQQQILLVPQCTRQSFCLCHSLVFSPCCQLQQSESKGVFFCTLFAPTLFLLLESQTCSLILVPAIYLSSPTSIPGWFQAAGLTQAHVPPGPPVASDAHTLSHQLSGHSHPATVILKTDTLSFTLSLLLLLSSSSSPPPLPRPQSLSASFQLPAMLPSHARAFR